MKNPLLDLNFLRNLDLMKDKATYAKIILLTWDENPVYEIQGRITAGSINIDGNSAVRRTCSLTMVSPDVDITNTYWALKNKFKLEVGVENTIDTQYPDIIWFKQGVYIFTSLNMNVQSNNFTISLNGKDKMCLLNGEVSGIINASTDFGKLEEYETLADGEIIRNIVDIPIVEIIKNAVRTYAKEPMHNIVLNDIDNYGLELLEYRGEDNLYMPRKVSTGEVSNFIINKKQKYYLKNGDEVFVDNEENKKAGNNEIIYYDRTQMNEYSATKVWVTSSIHFHDEEDAYNIIKIEYGETAGYRKTDLTYPGELVANVGDNLVSILDKIKQMFGDFEYFYDIDGRFIFQKKKTYVNTSFNNLITSEKTIYANDAAHTSSYTYSFEDGILLTAFTSAPQILNIKNDFSIWGKRKGVTGAELPVHMRYAIDFKPTSYTPIRFKYKKVSLNEKTYQPNKYYIRIDVTGKYILSTSLQFDNTKTYYEETEEQLIPENPSFTNDNYDWREIIYQMALDYFKYNHKKDNFNQLVAKANPDEYPFGVTGYEAYYTDLQGFWRQLYHPGVVNETYALFSHQELIDAAREVILQEREFIEEEDIAQLIIDYIYDNFDIIRNYFINQIDFAQEIEQRIQEGLDASSLIIQELLEHRWEKMGGVDNNDYSALMDEEAKENGENTIRYKLLSILKEFKEEQITSTTDYASLIIENLQNGVKEDSYTIQKLVITRWKKMQGNDTWDYEALKNEHINNGGSTTDANYRAWVLLEQYKHYQATDIAALIKSYIEKGDIDKKGDSVKKLLTIRWWKMGSKDTYDYESEKKKYLEGEGTSKEDSQYKLLEVLQAFKIEQEEVHKDIAAVIKQYVEGGFTQDNTIIQDLLLRRWDKMGGEDPYNYPLMMKKHLEDGGTIRDSQYKTLQILNNYKVQQATKEGKYDQIDFSKQIALKIQEGYVEHSTEIQELLVARWQKINGQDSWDYLSLMKEEYIENGESYNYQALVIMYNFKNKQEQSYINKEKIIIEEIDKNKFSIEQDAYLSFLFSSRQKKINNFGSDTKVVSNEKLIWIIVQVIKTLDWPKEKFKEQIEIMLDQQLNKNAYDFSQEIIDYIADNYSNKDEFFSIDPKTEQVIISDPHIQYLLDMRLEKIYEMGNDPVYIENDQLINIIRQALNNYSKSDDFKTNVIKNIETANNDALLKTDFTQEIIDFIYNNYNDKNIIKFDDNQLVTSPIKRNEKNPAQIEVVNDQLNGKFKSRKQKIDTYTNFQVFIDNTELLTQLLQAIEKNQQDKEKFKEDIQSRLKSATTTKKNLNPSPADSILIKVAGNAFTEVSEEEILEKLEDEQETIINYFKETYNEEGWNKNIETAPETLNFWFDFMSVDGQMGKYAAKVIGNRPKAINNDKVSGIYFQETPSVLFLTSEEYEKLTTTPEDFMDMTGYTFVKLQPFMENYFTISAQGKSAKDELDNLLYQHTYATESVNLTAVPIYYLQPNTRIFVKDDNTGINGEFIVSKITVPLQYNGTTAITTTRAVERIY